MCGWWSVLYLQKMHKYCLVKATCTSVLRCSGCAACKRRFERGPEGFPGGTGPALAEQVAPIYPQRDASRLKKGPNNRGKNCKYHITSHDPTTKNSPMKKPLFFKKPKTCPIQKMAIFSRLLSIHSVRWPVLFQTFRSRPSPLAGANERASPPQEFVHFLNDFLMTKDGSQWIFFSPYTSFFYDIG